MVLPALLLPAPLAGYEPPPADIQAILDAPYPASVSFSPDGEWMIEQERPSLRTLDELAPPRVKVAGIKLDPETGGPSRSYLYRGLALKHVRHKARGRAIALPEGARVSHLRWHPGTRGSPCPSRQSRAGFAGRSDRVTVSRGEGSAGLGATCCGTCSESMASGVRGAAIGWWCGLSSCRRLRRRAAAPLERSPARVPALRDGLPLATVKVLRGLELAAARAPPAAGARAA